MKTQTLAWSIAAALIAGSASAQTIDGAVADTQLARERAEAVMAQARDMSAQRGFDDAQREAERAQREKERAQREKEREGDAYEQGQSNLDAGRWDRAVASFDRVIDLKGPRADAALYWKAYAQNKLGQRAEALGTIAAIGRDFPKSRYLNDARALEVEIKQNTGQGVDPSAESNEDLKLLAISSLQNQNSEEAIPVLQKVLQGTGSPRLKGRALFVLAQSNTPKAREVLVNIAKGGSNPDLQLKAVQYLGVHGGRENRAALADIYAASSDVDLKKRILNAFMVAGDKERLLQAAQTEQNAELRAAAVQQLGLMGAHEELWAMYQKESTVDVKKNIIRAMFTGGDATRLTDIAKTDTNSELRLLAVRNLGMMGAKRSGDTLLDIYATDKDPQIKKAVINGLFVGGNADALVALARKEQDPTLKKEIVTRLSNMRSKAATDYLLELLNK
jgi:HEAT repeat protein